MNEEENKTIEELEEELEEGMQEMQEGLQEDKTIIEELEQKCKELTEELEEKDKIITRLKLKNKNDEVEIANLKSDALSDILLISNLSYKYYVKRKTVNEYAICDWDTGIECLTGDIEHIKFILEKIIGTRFFKEFSSLEDE